MIYLGEDVVNIRTLKEKISLKRRENPGLVVILRADKLVAFKNIVNVLDTLTELGISNLNIATVKE
ncbi:MAG: biopolymer transporter ExbD, partial [Candidatus Omnitrophica bacterium]|nr:biopolymer transporter ExbD [Candidatus Omnitrophota bacterium]